LSFEQRRGEEEKKTRKVDFARNGTKGKKKEPFSDTRKKNLRSLFLAQGGERRGRERDIRADELEGGRGKISAIVLQEREKIPTGTIETKKEGRGGEKKRTTHFF